MYTRATAVRGIVALLFVAWFGSARTAGAEVHLTMRDGRVTLTANNATVAEILAEWARVGQVRIVNGESVTGELISIELMDVPETQALDVVLRSVAGYIAGSRAGDFSNRSRFDRILIMPTSAPARTAASTVPSPPLEYSQYEQFPASPPDALADSTELAIPNPRGETGATYPASSPSLPAGASPSPAPGRVNGSRAGTGPQGQAPLGAPVPGMPVQPAPRTPPVYPPYATQGPPE